MYLEHLVCHHQLLCSPDNCPAVHNPNSHNASRSCDDRNGKFYSNVYCPTVPFWPDSCGELKMWTPLRTDRLEKINVLYWYTIHVTYHTFFDIVFVQSVLDSHCKNKLQSLWTFWNSSQLLTVLVPCELNHSELFYSSVHRYRRPGHGSVTPDWDKDPRPKLKLLSKSLIDIPACIKKF